MSKFWSGTLEVEMIEDNEDGSATVLLTADKSFKDYICDLGFNFLMVCAVAGITTDEAYERILGNDT